MGTIILVRKSRSHNAREDIRLNVCLFFADFFVVALYKIKEP